MTQPNNRISRRHFNKGAASLGALAGFHFFPALGQKRLEKPTLAGIGAGGKGTADIMGSSKAGFEIVALVDVVDVKKLSRLEGRLKRMGQTREAFPDAAFYADYREMLSDLGDKIDAVTVSTPDHHHFHASAMAMAAGKHVYCQKPLTHGIWEARRLAEIAAETGVKTQMGNQAHANDHMRRCIELIRAGVIGKVKEIHAWTNRPIWPQGFASPPKPEPVPEGIDWEQWIGPAPMVEYSPRIAPFAWRGWWNYGTGALGDMACHIMDAGYWAMQPESGERLAPQSVIAQQEGATDFSPPINSIITWDFGPSQYSAKDGFQFHWYDGYVNAHFDRDNWQLVKNGNEYNHPDEDVLDGMNFANYGSVIIGEEGKLFFHRSKKNWVLKSSSQVDGFEWPEPSLPRAREQDNYKEWMDAVSGKIAQSESNFSLAGPMTETILQGVLAQRVPDTRLEWDTKKMEVKGKPELKQMIQRPYRDGWNV
ncbi:MAG: Gfo/Idh/MocA family oxidoreductase [Planctomycetota bacterium]